MARSSTTWKPGQSGNPNGRSKKTQRLNTKKPSLPKGLAGVAGMHGLKTMLIQQVIEPLRTPADYERYGLNIPNGILLFGPPGCGKTYIARCLAEEIGCYFKEAGPSTVGSKYMHEVAVNLSNLFKLAEENAPTILFFDEIDALLPSRRLLSLSDGTTAAARIEEVCEFLKLLDSCAERKIFFIGATNEPSQLDKAAIRAGRLDKRIYVGPPDADARAEMLRLHIGDRPAHENLDFAVLAQRLKGYSASDIRLLVDEAARIALSHRMVITEGCLAVAIRLVPPSIDVDDELRFKQFETRGIAFE